MFPEVALAVALAHPAARDRYSLRAALRLDGDRLDALVVLEIPYDTVVKEVAAQAEGTAFEARDAHTRGVWDALGAALVLTVDDRPVPGAWRPSDSRYNGKGSPTEGFFLYVVQFEPAAPVVLGDAVSVRVTNTGWLAEPMTYSAMVMPGAGWTVVRSSLEGLLPDRAYDLNDPAFWIDDARLRDVSVTFGRRP